jgi:hypothetical protein
MKYIALIALLFGTFAAAQAPPQIQQLNDLPNAGALFIRYCSPAGKACVTRRAICYGQCCDPFEADDMGYVCYGDIEGSVPRGYKYVGWFCQMYNPSDKPAYGAKGDAGKKDPCPDRKNSR